MIYLTLLKLSCFLFADDVKLFNPIYSVETCNNLQHDLTSAKKIVGSETSPLKFHPDKCCNMRTGKPVNFFLNFVVFKLCNCVILVARPFHMCIPLTVIDSSLCPMSN